MIGESSGGMIEAGSETTSMSLNNMLLGILSNPEIVPRAHEELDRVVGPDRPPTFLDEPNLPYVRAIVKEVLRWRPINKFGQNHFATEVPLSPPTTFTHCVRTTGMASTLSPRGRW